MTTLFSNNDPSTSTPETPVVVDNALETLVGEGKKFKTIDDLAKGKLHSDTVYIPQLEKEAKALRDRVKELEEHLSEKKTMEEFLSEFRKTDTDSDDPGTNPATPNPSTARPQKTELDIDSLIEAKLEEKRIRDAAMANVATVEQELVKVWGDSYRNKLISVAKDLGLSHEFLGGIAEKSPKAFLDLVGATKKPSASDPNQDIPPRSSLQQGLNLQGAAVRNQAYYDKLKKTDPKAYHSEKITAQRHRDAQRLGEAFFN